MILYMHVTCLFIIIWDSVPGPPGPGHGPPATTGVGCYRSAVPPLWCGVGCCGGVVAVVVVVGVIDG